MPIQKDASHLSDYFPWLSEELAETVTRKLTQKELTQLRRELSEASDTVVQNVMKHLLTLKPSQRNLYIERVANREEEK